MGFCVCQRADLFAALSRAWHEFRGPKRRGFKSQIFGPLQAENAAAMILDLKQRAADQIKLEDGRAPDAAMVTECLRGVVPTQDDPLRHMRLRIFKAL
ncbi:MAG: hypothetical protein ACJASV_002677 [Pseudorhodobacter sp.]